MLSPAVESATGKLVAAYDVDPGATSLSLEKLLARTQTELGFERQVAEELLTMWLANGLSEAQAGGEPKLRFDSADGAINGLRAALGLSRPGIRWLREHLLGLLTFLGVIASAFASTLFGHATSRFYEDVGFAQSEIQQDADPQTSLFAAIAFIAVATGFLAVAVAPLIAVIGRGTLVEKRAPRRSEWRWFAALVCGAVVMVLSAAVQYPDLFDAALGGQTWKAAALLLLATGGLAAIRVWQHAAPLVAFNPQLGTIVASTLPVASVALLFIALPDLARSGADRVLKSEAVEPVAVLGIPLLDVRAEKATLRSISATPGVPQTACVLYLGKRDGQLLVEMNGRALRVPDERAVIETGPKKAPC